MEEAFALGANSWGFESLLRYQNMQEPIGDNTNMSKITKTDQELRELAFDIVAGRVFTSQDIKPVELDRTLGLVFLPVLFMDREQWLSFKEAQPQLIYEYLSERVTSRVINGYPQFGTARWLDQEELDRLIPLIDEVEKFKAGVSAD